MLVNDLESEVLAISSKYQKELLDFLIKLLEKIKYVGEQDIDIFMDRHKNFKEAELTKEEYGNIKKFLKKKNVEFSVFQNQENENYKLVFKFGDTEKVQESFKKLYSLKTKDNGLKELINESLNRFKINTSNSIDEKIKVKEFNIDER